MQGLTILGLIVAVGVLIHQLFFVRKSQRDAYDAILRSQAQRAKHKEQMDQLQKELESAKAIYNDAKRNAQPSSDSQG